MIIVSCYQFVKQGSNGGGTMEPNNPLSPEEQNQLIELGQRHRIRKRDQAAKYREATRKRGEDQTIIRIDKGILDRIREMASMSGTSLNSCLVSILDEKVRWREERFKEYSTGKIDRKTAMTALQILDLTDFVLCLVERNLRLTTEDEEVFDKYQMENLEPEANPEDIDSSDIADE